MAQKTVAPKPLAVLKKFHGKADNLGQTRCIDIIKKGGNKIWIKWLPIQLGYREDFFIINTDKSISGSLLRLEVSAERFTRAEILPARVTKSAYH